MAVAGGRRRDAASAAGFSGRATASALTGQFDQLGLAPGELDTNAVHDHENWQRSEFRKARLVSSLHTDVKVKPIPVFRDIDQYGQETLPPFIKGDGNTHLLPDQGAELEESHT